MHSILNLPSVRRFIVCAVLIGLTIFLSGCGVIQALLTRPAPADPGVSATQVAAQLTLWALASAPPAAAPTNTPVPLPTYTLPPTYTPLPTYTPAPTYTPIPTFTPFPSPTAAYVLQPLEPTQTPVAGIGRPYTLRVRNMFRGTYWIGARMPYGGNFIKPLWYVEFYPPQPTWMRVWFCRYTSYFYDHWDDTEWRFYQQYWDGRDRWDDSDFWNTHNYLYNCNYRDVYVDQPFIEIGVP